MVEGGKERPTGGGGAKSARWALKPTLYLFSPFHPQPPAYLDGSLPGDYG
jgi:hypothetical protein